MRIILVALSMVVSLSCSAQEIGACFDPALYHSADTAAEQNFETGSRYFVQRQYTPARHYLELSAAARHPRAEELLGQMYMFGYGVPISQATAHRYLSAAAALGHRGAIADMGFYYSQVEIDLPRANKYFLAAARCGNLDAQAELGLNYEFGRGVERDRKQAIYWLLQAAPHWGQAGFIAQWLEDPKTPQFQDVDQLGRYVSAKTNQRIQFNLPRSGWNSGYKDSTVHPQCGSAGVAPGTLCQGYGGGTMNKPQ